MVRVRKLSRKWKPRRALLRSMLTSLVVHERIKTTLARAKELRRWADRAVTWAKRATDASSPHYIPPKLITLPDPHTKIKDNNKDNKNKDPELISLMEQYKKQRLSLKGKRVEDQSEFIQYQVKARDKMMSVKRKLWADLLEFPLKPTSNAYLAADKLLYVLAPRYAQRPGGYSRVLHFGFRPGDHAPLALIEFVKEPYIPKISSNKDETASTELKNENNEEENRRNKM